MSGRSGWQDLSTGRAGGRTLYIDVPANFKTKPLFFATMVAGKANAAPAGAHVVHCASSHGFRLYVTHSVPITAARAENDGWRVSWVGIESAFHRGHTGSASGLWQHARSAVVGKVQLPAAGQIGSMTPALIGALEVAGDSHVLGIQGADMLYDTSRKGFKIYLRDAGNAAAFLRKLHHVVVNWVALGSDFGVPRDCKFTEWGDWSPCGRTCRSSGGHEEVQHRFRRVLSRATAGGRPCFNRTAETQECRIPVCPRKIDCRMTWGNFTKCTKTCGGGKR